MYLHKGGALAFVRMNKLADWKESNEKLIYFFLIWWYADF